MELSQSRCLIAGATGDLGSRMARALAEEGACIGLAGRDRAKLSRLGEELEAPTARFDAAEPAGCASAVDSLAAALGGLDAAIVMPGVAGFGAADGLETQVIEELFLVNAVAPIALISAATAHLEPGGMIVATSAIVAEHPTAGVAHYSAAKAALSAYLSVLRRELRRPGIGVIDVRPPHLATGFADRPLAGRAPALPEPMDPDEVVGAVLSAMREERREVAWDLRERSLVVR